MKKGDTFDPTRVTWVLTDRALARLHAVLEAATEISLDIESTGLDEFAPGAKIVLVSFTVPAADGGADTWLLPLYHPESPWLGTWRRIYRRVARCLVGKYLIAHNGKFDCRWTFAHTGVDLSGSLMWDTRISSHLLDENSSSKLKDRAPRTFSVPPWDEFDFTKPGAALLVSLIDLGLYAARDTYWTWRLAEHHRRLMFVHPDADQPMAADEIEDARLGRLCYWVAMPTVRTMSRLEQRGILLDTAWVGEHIAADQQIRDESAKHLTSRYPEMNPTDYSFASTSHWFRAWADKAVAADDLKVAALTPTGMPSWSKGVLVRQARNGSEVAGWLLEYRRAIKRLEYLTSWLGFVQADGAIHANYNVGTLITGRLSSDSPNMQQITKPLRPAFLPRPGYVIADFDYSQIELRVAAFIGRIAPMIEAFQRGDDLHRMLAARITGKRAEEVTDGERNVSKPANFGLLYGLNAFGFREYAETVYDVSFTMEEAEKIHRTFFEMWDGMREWHADTIGRARHFGQVVSPIGRVRRLPQIYDRNEKVASYAERAAVNAPVQGFASDLMQIAAASITGTLPGSEPVKGVHLVATVHDSIVAEVEEGRWEEATQECLDRMVNAVLPVLKRLDCDMDVPLAAEAKVGSRWGLADVGSLE